MNGMKRHHTILLVTSEPTVERAKPGGGYRLPPVAQAIVMVIGLALSAAPSAGQMPVREVSGELEELTRWARTVVADGRPEQLGLRFAPILSNWRQAGRTAQSRQLLSHWTRLVPGASGAWLQLGDLLGELQEFPEAIEVYSKGIEAATASDGLGAERNQATPVLVDLHLGLAMASWELGDVATAERSFELVLDNAPSQFALLQWTRFLAWQGRAVEALEVLGRLPKQLRDRGDVVLLEAKVCAASIKASDTAGSSQGACDAQAALASFQRAVELLPDHAEAHYGLARSYLRVGERDRAAAAMSRYRQLLTEDLEATLRPRTPDGVLPRN